MRHLIIDGNNLLFRCYWAAHKKWHESKPNMYGYFFLNVIKSYISLFQPRDIIVTWDERMGSEHNQRKDIAEEYKANRVYNSDVFAYIEDIKELLNHLGVRQLYPLNREGDDIMYWLFSIKYPESSVLVTTDTDMYQLVRENMGNNIIYNPQKNIQVNSFFLKSTYDVSNGSEFIIKKALKGDKSDNIFGIKGIRKGRVQQVIDVYKTKGLEGLRASGILNNNEMALFVRNMELMSLDKLKNYKDEIEFYESQMTEPLNPDMMAFREKVKEMEYWNICKNYEKWYAAFQPKDDYLFIFDK